MIYWGGPFYSGLGSVAHFNSHFWSISFSSIKKYERFGRTPLPPPCNVAAGRYKNQDSIKMSFVQHCCREGGAPARKRYKIAAESPRLLVTMECQNACKESATSTVIAFESQRNTVTQWETQRFVMGRTEAFRSSKNPRLGATGPPRQT